MNASRPWLSVVIVGRNDNYGGDFKQRLLDCVSSLCSELTAARIESELIFINYNPISAPPIEEFIQWPTSDRHVTLRLLTVSDSVHKLFTRDGTRSNVQVLEFLAKNAGIRRAKGDFILCMNADIVLPLGFASQLKHLSEDFYYRADRFDFLPFEVSGRKMERSVIRINLKGHSFSMRPRSISGLYRLWILSIWRLAHIAYRIRTALTPRGVHLYEQCYDRRAEMHFHCHASGDFMLMHRSRWNAIRGYNEHSRISTHVDSLLVIQAAMSGLKEHVFQQPVYHREHERRYDPRAQKQDYIIFQREAQEMLETKTVKLYNDENWGLAAHSLPMKLL